ncbi:serine/threonine-protein kinase mos-like [Dendronephthya gigantea]|uniref:serine/threonine-protein kinase mos-like n=1 Tax=Dendronephthya gigantea TaxID=151771 RepID=UPI00106AB72F|nr:serine/threonine-protein kinase mos-like [Dendronephthya gigantea]
MLASPRPRPLNLDLSHVPKQEKHNSHLTDESMSCFSTNLQIQVCDPIGSGGFGTVYCGLLDNQKIAVKKLRSNTKTKDLVWNSFLAELRVMRLNHDNIVKVLGAMTLENTPCLVMEFAGNRNLQELIECKDEELSISRRLDISSAVACGLEYIHNQGLVHLDIKPANLIINSESSCKIADFGCSLKIDELDGDLRPNFYLTGTHAYKAPELLLGEFPTTQADVYSLGICMWQMLSRVEPYAGEDPQLVIFGIATNSVRPRLPKGLPESDGEYRKLFQKCWNGAPHDRPTPSALQIQLSVHRDLA